MVRMVLPTSGAAGQSGWVESSNGAEHLDGDALVKAEQVEREGVGPACRGIVAGKAGRYEDRRRRGVELAHEIDGIHTHVRVGAEHVQWVRPGLLRGELLQALLRADALKVLDPGPPCWLAGSTAPQQRQPATHLVQLVSVWWRRRLTVTRLCEARAPWQQSDRPKDPSRRAAVRSAAA
eukprot:7077964-Prymnesium_polylepis.1